MRALIVGCGSIGERHLKNLFMLGILDVAVCDADQNRLKCIRSQYPVEGYASLQEALAKCPEVTLVCTPTQYHLPVALAAAEIGSHLFIEKPLSDHLSDDIQRLADVIDQRGLQCLVGCNMRFHPALDRIYEALNNGVIGEPLSLRAHFGHYLPNWRPQQDYQLSYSAQRCLGGGVILDAIHEIDYARWFLGEVMEVFCYGQKTGDLDIDVEDCADILLRFVNGRVASIHLDYLDRLKRRSCDLVGSKGTIVWRSTGKKPEYATLELHFDNRSSQVDRFEVETNGPYLEEIQHLLHCIEGTDEPLLNIKDAMLDLAVAVAAMKSATTGSTVRVGTKV